MSENTDDNIIEQEYSFSIIENDNGLNNHAFYLQRQSNEDMKKTEFMVCDLIDNDRNIFEEISENMLMSLAHECYSKELFVALDAARLHQIMLHGRRIRRVGQDVIQELILVTKEFKKTIKLFDKQVVKSRKVIQIDNYFKDILKDLQKYSAKFKGRLSDGRPIERDIPLLSDQDDRSRLGYESQELSFGEQNDPPEPFYYVSPQSSSSQGREDDSVLEIQCIVSEELVVCEIVKSQAQQSTIYEQKQAEITVSEHKMFKKDLRIRYQSTETMANQFQ